MSIEVTASISPTVTPPAATGDAAAAPTHDGPVLAYRCEGLLPEPCRVDIAASAGVAAAPSALDHALLVADAEPLCLALERWLRAGFDLVPLDATSGAALPVPAARFAVGGDVVAGPEPIPEPAPLRLRIAHRSASGPTLTLHLPAHLLPILRAVPEEVAVDADVRFDPLPATCRVARLALSAAQLARFGPGAVLLLPETFAGAWPVTLCALGVAAAARLDPVAARIDVGHGRLDPDDPSAAAAAAAADVDAADVDAATAADATRHRVDVVLDAPVDFDPGRVLGGAGPAHVALPAALPYVGFHCRIDGRARLAGHVASVGAGYGFFALRAVGDTESERGAEGHVEGHAERREGNGGGDDGGHGVADEPSSDAADG